MPLRFEPVRLALAGEDTKSKFQIDLIRDPEWGWEASLTLNAWGSKDPQAAVADLVAAAQAFVEAAAGGVEIESTCRDPGSPCRDPSVQQG